MKLQKRHLQNFIYFSSKLLITTIFSLTLIGSASAEKQVPSNKEMLNAVETELYFDSSIITNNIDVFVVEGIVTLNGTVDNILSRDRASEVAGLVKGVRAVNNNLEVKKDLMESDRDIKRNIVTAVISDPVADSYELTVQVSEGKVTVSGVVDSWQEKEHAINVAKGIKGVRSVEDEMRVEWKTERPDSEIKKDIEASLKWNVLVDESFIEVNIKDGNVELSGNVGSLAEKREATVSSWVLGVTSVNAESLDVDYWFQENNLREKKYPVVSDQDIKKAIKDAFFYHPRVKSFNIDVRVSESDVTLRGVVDNLKAKKSAVEVAQNTTGVLDVKSFLKVRPQIHRQDKELGLDIMTAIMRSPYLENSQISVMVNNGVAYLSGRVLSGYEKAWAEDIASNTRGVIAVKNNLLITDDKSFFTNPFVDGGILSPYQYFSDVAWKSDAIIKKDIEKQLFWSPMVFPGDIEVEVSNGVATLSGMVGSFRELEAAQTNALQGGAIGVVNNLKVM